MENNLRDTPLRRFNTFWWGLGLFVIFGLAVLILKNFFQSDDISTVDQERGKERLIKYEQVQREQAALLEYKKDGSSVQLPPEDLFSIASEIKLLNTTPAESAVAHGK